MTAPAIEGYSLFNETASDIVSGSFSLDPAEILNNISHMLLSELRAFSERWAVARLLDEGLKTYREIGVEAGASPTTVVRVARFLREMDHQGYRLVLDRLNKKA